MNSSILIIDDDTELTDLLTQYLGTEGFEVSCVHDGEQGVKKALHQSYDAIILDVMLPKLNGFEVLKFLNLNKINIKNNLKNEVEKLDIKNTEEWDK